MNRSMTFARTSMATMLTVAGLGMSLVGCKTAGTLVGPVPAGTDVVPSPRADAAPATSRPAPRSREDDEATGQAIDEDWPTEVLNSEAGATKKVVLDAISKQRALTESAAAVFDDAFLGERFDARETTSLGTQSGVSLQRWQASALELDGTAWREAFNRWLGEWRTITAVEVHTWELQLEESTPEGMVGLFAKEALWVVGDRADGSVREDRFYLNFNLRKPVDGSADSWRITAISSADGRTAIGSGPFFVDVTDDALPGGYDQIGAGIYTDGGPALADFDGDGDQDLFLPRQHASAILYENDGAGRFKDVTLQRGLSLPSLDRGSISGVFFDDNNDGRLDLAVGAKGGGIRLFRNEGAQFRDLTGAVAYGSPGEWMTLAVADYDGDGYTDLFASNYGVIDTDHQPSSYIDARDGRPNLLLRNDAGSGRLIDATDDSGLGEGNDRWTYAAAWADYDRDADMDLWVANDFGPSQLFRNNGRGHFEEISEAVGAVNLGNGMGASWLDYDGDLDLDLYLSNMQSFAGNRITRLKNFPGTAEQQQLYRRFSQGNTLLSQQPDGTFTDATDAAGVRAAFWAWGNVGLDYDADNDMDIFGAAGFYTGDSTADT